MQPTFMCRTSSLTCISALFLSSCLLTVDLDTLSNEECPEETKLCGGECVSKTNPQNGCGQESCVPCTLQHATARCEAEHCAIAACKESYRDCDQNPENGCEIDIDHDPLHCGSCTASPCEIQNAVAGCSAGQCAVESCAPGFADCDEKEANGCEVTLATDPVHCSECNMSCAEGLTCEDGQCR